MATYDQYNQNSSFSRSISSFDDSASFSYAVPPPPPCDKKHVKFHQVIVRLFNPTLSDNPSVSCGPPVGLDWSHAEKDVFSDIDDYEEFRSMDRKELSVFARMGRLDPEFRLKICQDAGYSDEELEICLTEIREIQERMILQVSQCATSAVYWQYY